MKINRVCIFSVAMCVAMFGSAVSVFPQTSLVFAKPRIVVFGFLNLTGDQSFTIPTETATENLSFSLRLLNRYETVESDMILRDLSDARLARYCASESLDFILYGTLTQGADGKQKYELALFDRQKAATTVRESATGESVMDVFDIADRLSASVLGTIIGRRLTFGSIRLANAGKPADFDAYVDGVKARSGEGTIDHVPDGPHAIRLVRKDAIPAGSPISVEYAAMVTENSTASVSFVFEPLASQVVASTVISPSPVDSAETVDTPDAVSANEETPVSDEVPPEEVISEEPDAKEVRLRTGVLFGLYGFGEKTFDDFSDLMTFLVGGGVSTEFTGRHAGFAIRAQGCIGYPADTDISQYFGLSALGGPFLRFVSKNRTFEFRPEIDGGVWWHVLSFSGDNDWSGIQYDPAIQASLAFLACGNSASFEIAPFATVLPEKSGKLIMGGLRLGLIIGGKQ